MFKIFISILIVCSAVLTSCSYKSAKRPEGVKSEQQVVLEIELKKPVVDRETNQPFGEDVQVISVSNNQLKISVEPEGAEEIKKQLQYKGYKVVNQYRQTKTVESKTQTNNQSFSPKLDLPEITFPNIFKALLVFYQ